MTSNRRHPRGLGLVFCALFGATAAQAATLPADTCTSTGPTSRTCNLSAGAGTLTLPDGAVVPVWSYALQGAPAGVPGPVLIVNQGETITVNLTNNLTEPTALLFHGQPIAPDLVGAAANGGTVSYTFVASAPGTFLYEAGLLPNAQHQVAMGLYGVLIVRTPPNGAPSQGGPATVRPVPDQAYAIADGGSAFDDEAVVVLGEIDPALNTHADPAAFDMRDFAPKYFLINGKAYPQTDVIATTPGNRVLLRYVNAGLTNHAMALLGLDEAVLAVDGNVKPFAGRVVSESIGSGQSLDAIATIPATAAIGSRFPLYDASFSLHNNGAPGFGGMLTFLTTGAGGAGSGGPSTNNVAVAPTPTNGLADVVLTAQVTNAGGTVTGAEYFLDLEGAPGTGTPMAAADGAFGSASEAVTATISAAKLAALPSGFHVLIVHGQGGGGWGPVNFTVLNLDMRGPVTTGATLMPHPANGTEDVMLSATGDDRPSGGSIVTGGEYFIDMSGAPGTGTPLMANLSASEVDLTAMIPAATVAALAEGDHLIAIRSQDALGNWGALTMATLQLDRTGPDTLDFTATPNPNNGQMAINSTVPVVRLTATFSDVPSGNTPVAAAEAFFDVLGATGTGIVFSPVDGLFDSAFELGFADIPLATISLLASGPHPLYAHARDTAGNWGPTRTVLLSIDRSGPSVSGFTASPNPTNAGPSNNTSFTLTANATDLGFGGSNLARAEWFEGADPGKGNGFAMQAADGAFDSPSEQLRATPGFASRGWSSGNHSVSVRARDAANNWSGLITGTVNIVQPNFLFADNFEARNLGEWSNASGDLRFTNTGAMKGLVALRARLSATPAYVTDTSPTAEPSYHARFYFNPNSASTGGGIQTIFSGRDSNRQTLFQIELRGAAGAYEVRAWVRTSGGPVTTPFVAIGNGAHVLELGWSSASAATLTFNVDAATQTLTNLSTQSYRLESVRLGPSSGLTGSVSGSELFDAFVSTRRTVIGP